MRTSMGSADVRRMLKDLLCRLEASDESKKKMSKQRNFVKRMTFKKSAESFACESFDGVPVEEIEEFICNIAKVYKFCDEVKDYTFDAMRNGYGRQGSINDVRFDNGIFTILLFDCIVKTRAGKRDLVFAMYKWSVELAEAMKSTYYLFGFIRVSVKTANRGEITMNEDQKNLITTWCREKLHDHVASKCRKKIRKD